MLLFVGDSSDKKKAPESSPSQDSDKTDDDPLLTKYKLFYR